MRVRNNQLLARRKALGLSQKMLADAIGVNLAMYGALETLRARPFSTRRGDARYDADGILIWTDVALAIAGFYDIEPEVLFPEAIREIQQASAVRLVDGDELKTLLGAGLSEGTRRLAEPPNTEDNEQRVMVRVSLSTLTAREEKVLRLRFGIGEESEHTMEEVGAILKRCDGGKGVVLRERVRRIEEKALRKLRHSSRAKHLQSLWRDDTDLRKSVGECVICTNQEGGYADTQIYVRPYQDKKGNLYHPDCYERLERQRRRKRIEEEPQ